MDENTHPTLFMCNAKIVNKGEWDEGYGMKGDGYILNKYVIQFEGLPCALDSSSNERYGPWKYGNMDSLFSQDQWLTSIIFDYQLKGREIKAVLGELRKNLEEGQLFYKTWSSNDQKFEMYVYDPQNQVLYFISVWI